jgi:hypothetical protein
MVMPYPQEDTRTLNSQLRKIAWKLEFIVAIMRV